jgi:hypothetical protein
MIKPFTTDEEKKQESKERKQTEPYKEKTKEYWKKYYTEHKEDLIENQKKYKDKIQERRTEKITCVCGSIIARGNKSAHEKTFVHISHTQPLFKPIDELNT